MLLLKTVPIGLEGSLVSVILRLYQRAFADFRTCTPNLFGVRWARPLGGFMASILFRRLKSNRVALLQAMLLAVFVFPTTSMAQSTALQFVPVTPCRVVDTRNPQNFDLGGPRLAVNETRTIHITWGSCGIPSTAMAYSFNASVVPVTTLRWLNIYPFGAQPAPSTSTLNSYDGRVKGNAVIVAAGTDGAVNVYAREATDLILDINGYFVPAATNSASLEFYPVPPCRVADTRNAAGPQGGPSISGGSTRSFPVQSSSCGIPANAQVYSLSIAAAPMAGLGYLTAWAAGQDQPGVSTLNAPTGTVAANAAIVAAGSNGDVSIYASDTTDVIIDVNGYFGPPTIGGLSLYTVPECRVIDTRSGSGPFNGTMTVPVQGSSCAAPAGAQAYLLNAAVVPVGSLSYLTLWADGTSQPNVSTLNAYDGSITSNMAIVSNTTGSIKAYATSSTDLIFDLFGYFAQ